MFVNNTATQEELHNMLAAGIVTVSFTKKDGSLRTMRCTLSPNILPPVLVEDANKKEKSRCADVCPVFDVDANAWRSFRWDSIKTYTA